MIDPFICKAILTINIAAFDSRVQSILVPTRIKQFKLKQIESYNHQVNLQSIFVDQSKFIELKIKSPFRNSITLHN